MDEVNQRVETMSSALEAERSMHAATTTSQRKENDRLLQQVMALERQVLSLQARLEVETGRGQRLAGEHRATMAEVASLRPLEQQVQQVCGCSCGCGGGAVCVWFLCVCVVDIIDIRVAPTQASSSNAMLSHELQRRVAALERLQSGIGRLHELFVALRCSEPGLGAHRDVHSLLADAQAAAEDSAVGVPSVRGFGRCLCPSMCASPAACARVCVCVYVCVCVWLCVCAWGDRCPWYKSRAPQPMWLARTWRRCSPLPRRRCSSSTGASPWLCGCVPSCRRV